VNHFFEFIVNHWMLCSLALLLIIFIIIEEIRGWGQGVSRLQPSELTHLINREDAAVIDVRDNQAFAKGHIIGSINIPHIKMDASIEKIKKYQDRPIVLVCGNGQTASQEGIKLKNKGFEKIYCLSGGLTAWKEAGLPLIKE
jgi:rhodanese-related sulfurtransferase